MDGPKLKQACIAAISSVAGMDAFSPDDFKQLSDTTYAWLACLLQLVEQGEPWPQDVLRAKSAFQSKDQDKIDDPLEYRALLILPVLYRRWASTRLNDLKPWIKEWHKENMFAGIEG